MRIGSLGVHLGAGGNRPRVHLGYENYTVATVGDSSPAVMGEGLYPLTTR